MGGVDRVKIVSVHSHSPSLLSIETERGQGRYREVKARQRGGKTDRMSRDRMSPASSSSSLTDVRFHVIVCPSMEHVVPTVGTALVQHACGQLNVHRVWKIVDDLKEEHMRSRSRETMETSKRPFCDKDPEDCESMQLLENLSQEVVDQVRQYLLDLLNAWNVHLARVADILKSCKDRLDVARDPVIATALQRTEAPKVARPASLSLAVTRFRSAMIDMKSRHDLRPQLLRCKERFERRLLVVQRPIRRAFLKLCERFLNQEATSGHTHKLRSS